MKKRQHKTPARPSTLLLDRDQLAFVHGGIDAREEDVSCPETIEIVVGYRR